MLAKYKNLNSFRPICFLSILFKVFLSLIIAPYCPQFPSKYCKKSVNSPGKLSLNYLVGMEATVRVCVGGKGAGGVDEAKCLDLTEGSKFRR